MKLKPNISYNNAIPLIKKAVSTHIKVSKGWSALGGNHISIAQSYNIGVIVRLEEDAPYIGSYVPNLLYRSFFGGIIGGLLNASAQREFREQITHFIISEFYE